MLTGWKFFTNWSHIFKFWGCDRILCILMSYVYADQHSVRTSCKTFFYNLWLEDWDQTCESYSLL